MCFSTHSSVNLQDAKNVDGWVTYVNADDITGMNRSPFDEDDEILATKEVRVPNCLYFINIELFLRGHS